MKGPNGAKSDGRNEGSHELYLAQLNERFAKTAIKYVALADIADF